MDALNERFAKTTLKFFEKHGIKVIGFWIAIIGTSNVLYYMLAYEDLAHRERAWNAFSHGSRLGEGANRNRAESRGPTHGEDHEHDPQAHRLLPP